MEHVTRSMIGNVALRMPDSLQKNADFWTALFDAVIVSTNTLHAATKNDDDALAEQREGCMWIAQSYRRLALWNPWDIAELTNSSISLVMEQLLLSVECDGLQLVFALCCPQCSCELGRWATVETLMQAIVASAPNGVQCPLCADTFPLSVAEDPTASPFLMERIKVFASPTASCGVKEFPLAISGLRTISTSLTQPEDSLLHVSPMETVARCENLLPHLRSSIIASLPCWPAAAKMPPVSRLMFLPAGKYLVLIPDAAITMTIVVASDPDIRESSPVTRVPVCVAELILLRRNSLGSGGRRGSSSKIFECRHGALQLDIVNETNICGVLHILPWCDTRTAWRTGPVDLSGPSNQRLFSLSTLLHYIPGGLSNTALWDLASPPVGWSLQFPSSTMLCAVNFREGFARWDALSAEARYICAQAFLDVVVGAYHGLVVEVSSGLEHIFLMFRSPTLGIAALLSGAQMLATMPVPCVADLGVFAYGRSMTAPFSLLIEGSVVLGRHSRQSNGRRFPTPSSSQCVQFSGSCMNLARKVMYGVPTTEVLSPESAPRPAVSVIVALASVDPKTHELCPFGNQVARDILVDTLLEALPFKFDGLSVECAIGGNFVGIQCSVQQCLGATECLSLPTVLDPSMVDPLHVSCSDSV